MPKINNSLDERSPRNISADSFLFGSAHQAYPEQL